MIARIGWWLFALAALLTLTGTAGNLIASHSYIVPLTLKPGYSTHVDVFRLQSDYVDLDLWHAYEKDQERPELGTYSHEKRPQGYYVDDPGQPVIIQVSTTIDTVIYEAGPRVGRGSLHITKTSGSGSLISRRGLSAPRSTTGSSIFHTYPGRHLLNRPGD